ncbi:Asp23/Gls24 family envelope stress response protein [Pseudalkalibacillus caeni]|uniref:Asp23/Gls24 family envelope stress response protein n=1 Tax=Exobacillus caeni TaxID=2574798 RepID=A0A5R9F7A0_9BACL|nr:Asp23/Gls24 family envelope stress response protein [Pseudalkalibacillus caeni]TLS36374.1 Asp23/Gls24 family envelope stress response protein [Pseudalkalibacillus caeni]
MNEMQSFEMEEHETGLGKVEISPEVIEVIGSIAASEVDGVAAMRGNFASGVAERLGRKNHGKGVKVELGEEGITLDIYVVVTYGLSIPETGTQIQDNVRQALLTMTALDVSAINIHVVGITFDKQEDEDNE